MAYKIRSKFIKNIIKGKSFRNGKFRKYIDDLGLLERAIRFNGGYGWNFGTAQPVEILKEEHKKEFQEIFKELDPKGFKKYLNEKEKERLKELEEDKKWAEEERKELEQEKKEWIKAGGVLRQRINISDFVWAFLNH